MAMMTQDLPHAEPNGNPIEPIMQFYGAMPTGISVSHSGRIFVNYPKWGDKVDFTVAEIVDGKEVAFPNAEINKTDPNNQAETLVSVQSIVVDPLDRLWILDTGSPMFQPTQYGGPKLVGVDLKTNQVFKKILFPPDVALPTSYVNDVRFDLRRGSEGMAFITDSSDKGKNGIVVVDLGTGESWRRLHDHPTTLGESPATFLPVVEGQPFMEREPDGNNKPVLMGSDGIAISADGARLFYCPLASRTLYSVSVDALVDRTLDDNQVAATIINEGNKGCGSDGLESDSDGNIYLTDYEHNAVLRRLPDGEYETIAHDPRMLWPDTMSVATDGYLYFTANQLHRQPKYHQNKDLRQKPYSLFRVRINAKPVLLKNS